MAGPVSWEVSDSVTPGSCSEGPWAWLNALLLPSWNSSYFLNTRPHSPTLLSCTGSPSSVASPDRESTFGLHRWICPPNRCYRTLLWADVILSPASVSILTERRRQIDRKAGATEASGSLSCVAPSKALGGAFRDFESIFTQNCMTFRSISASISAVREHCSEIYGSVSGCHSNRRGAMLALGGQG